MKAVKVGDLVILHSRGAYDSIRKVTRVTPKGSFRIEGLPTALFDSAGIEKGGDVWSFLSVTEATDEDIARINQETLVRRTMKKCHALKVDDLSYEQWSKIYTVLREANTGDTF